MLEDNANYLYLPNRWTKAFYEWQDRNMLAIFYACLILAFR